jgi:predicted Na+-dependent transporter
MMIHGQDRLVFAEFFLIEVIILDCRTPNTADTMASSIQSAKYQLVISGNLVLTIFAMFAIGYLGGSKLGYSKNEVCIIATSMCFSFRRSVCDLV